MSMKSVTQSLLVVCVIWVAGVAAGQPRVERRQGRQGARISAGVQQGQLSEAEAARLAAGQARVQARQNHAQADGVVNVRERVQIERAQNRQSRRIRRARSN